MQEYYAIENKYRSCSSFFTHGTKSNAVAGCCCVGPSGTQVQRMSSSASVFSAELHVLLLTIAVVLKEKLFTQTL